jgi:hypothetical protein
VQADPQSAIVQALDLCLCGVGHDVHVEQHGAVFLQLKEGQVGPRRGHERKEGNEKARCLVRQRA